MGTCLSICTGSKPGETKLSAQPTTQNAGQTPHPQTPHPIFDQKQQVAAGNNNNSNNYPAYATGSTASTQGTSSAASMTKEVQAQQPNNGATADARKKGGERKQRRAAGAGEPMEETAKQTWHMQKTVITGQVRRVFDGDTIDIVNTGNATNEKIRIRFAHIDAPESDQAYGLEAQNALSSLILNKTVDIVVETVDKYHRTVGLVFLPVGGNHNNNSAVSATSGNGKQKKQKHQQQQQQPQQHLDPRTRPVTESVNFQMVVAGCAWYYGYYRNQLSVSEHTWYSEAEERARAGKIGLWAALDSDSPPVEPHTWRLYSKGEIADVNEVGPNKRNSTGKSNNGNNNNNNGGGGAGGGGDASSGAHNSLYPQLSYRGAVQNNTNNHQPTGHHHGAGGGGGGNQGKNSGGGGGSNLYPVLP